VAYGYRYDEVPLTLPEIKSDLKISFPRQSDTSRRVPVQVTLGCHLEGAACPHPDPVDPWSMVAGVCKRFGVKVPMADPAALDRLRTFVRKYIREHFVPLPADADTSVSTWLKGTDYPAWRKTELLTKWAAVENVDDPKYLVCKSFMKDEVYSEFKFNRGINARSDEFKCMVGPIFKLIESVVYDDHHFIKHVPVADRPAYISRLLGHGTKFLASDYTAFESLFVQILMETVEFELYEYMVMNLPEGPAFMERCRNVLGGVNVCNYRDFQVQLKAVRMSGEMCTSLGNGFSNLMFMLFVCMEAGSTEVEGVVEGDDGLFVVNGPAPTSADFAKLGLIIKLEEHDKLSTASFCGIVFDEEDLVNIREPYAVLATFGWTSQRYANSKPKILRALLRCKALSLAHQYPGCPIVAALARYGMRVTDDVAVCKMLRTVNARGAMNAWEREWFLELIQKGRPPELAVPLRTRLLMEEKFGVSVTDQLRIEAYLDSLTTIQPLRIDTTFFPPTWKAYWDTYVCAPLDLEHPDLAVHKNGNDVLSLFDLKGGWLLPKKCAPARS